MKQVYESAHNDNVSCLCKRKFSSSENVAIFRLNMYSYIIRI